MSSPWWESRPYRDTKMRREQLECFWHQQCLNRRRFIFREPLACLAASVAIAGAAALSRTSMMTFDHALDLLADPREFALEFAMRTHGRR